MLLSPRKKGLTSLFKEVRVFKVILALKLANSRLKFANTPVLVSCSRLRE